ncbi:MAG: mitochondrial fission ELM1 family protein [Candidatus Puniceispirillaceae bacterium]
MGQAQHSPDLWIWQQRKEAHLRKAATSVWSVSDGTAGMRYQSLALAAIMGWDQSADFRDIVVTPHPILRHLPRLGHWVPGLPLTQDATPPVATISRISDYPNILVTCGRRMAGMSIALKARARRDGADMTTIHLQDPRLDPAYFDMLIVPHHDRARGDNVIVTKAALNRMNKSHIAASADSVPQHWSSTASPRVAVMIGGDNRRYKISNDMAVQMAQQLAAFAAANDAHLFLVPSRRCPDLTLSQLTSALPRENCFIATNDQPNPYPGVLAMADAVIVTSDSVNMASEAASTGKPVLIAYWQAETGRIAKFHHTMQAGKHTAPLTKMMPAEPFVPLDESAMVRQQVSARLSG